MIFHNKIGNTEAAIGTLDHMVALVGHLIWPFTLLLILFLFRKKFATVFDRLGSLKAGASGLEMTFDTQIEKTEQLLLSKSGLKPKPGVQVKRTAVINQRDNSPYHQLLDIRESLHSQIINKAQEFNIHTKDKTSLVLCEDLREVDGITLENAQYFNALINLTSSGGTKINQAQVDRVKRLYENLQL